MKTTISMIGLLILSLLAFGCGGDKATNPTPEPPEESNLPEIPIPDSPNELLPGVSENFTVAVSDEIESFDPLVTELQMMQDDSSLAWVTMDRRTVLGCADVLTRYTSDSNIADNTYITARPRLLHQRYWRKIKQVTLAPGNANYTYEETITSGTSTTHEESYEFSQTMGIEVSAGGGWGPFSVSVSASFEQTETHGEMDSVTFDEETSVSETFSVQADPSRTTVYAIWQLVDEFSFVDADTIAINESPTVKHARITPIASIVFPNRDMIYQSSTYFQ